MRILDQIGTNYTPKGMVVLSPTDLWPTMIERDPESGHMEEVPIPVEKIVAVALDRWKTISDCRPTHILMGPFAHDTLLAGYLARNPDSAGDLIDGRFFGMELRVGTTQGLEIFCDGISG